MAVYDQKVARLLEAANEFISKNVELNFAAETVAGTALAVAGGDVQRAESLLCSMEIFSRSAMLKMSEDHIYSSRQLISASRKLLDKRIRSADAQS